MLHLYDSSNHKRVSRVNIEKKIFFHQIKSLVHCFLYCKF